MSTKHDFIFDVSPRKQSWTLVVRVVRAWFFQDYKNKKLPFSMEMVCSYRFYINIYFCLKYSVLIFVI